MKKTIKAIITMLMMVAIIASFAVALACTDANVARSSVATNSTNSAYAYTQMRSCGVGDTSVNARVLGQINTSGVITNYYGALTGMQANSKFNYYTKSSNQIFVTVKNNWAAYDPACGYSHSGTQSGYVQ